MTLEAGTLLGAYRIVAPIGAGGMGEVFLAQDSRLERNVALKILPRPSPAMRSASEDSSARPSRPRR